MVETAKEPTGSRLNAAPWVVAPVLVAGVFLGWRAWESAGGGAESDAAPLEEEADIDPALLARLFDPSVDDVAPGAPGGPPGGTAGASRGEGVATAPIRATDHAVIGDADHASTEARVGVIDVAVCFDAIPAWQEIQRKGLKRTKARYHFLLLKANEALGEAVQSVATDKGLKVVLRRGGFTGGIAKQCVDLTDAVVLRLGAGS